MRYQPATNPTIISAGDPGAKAQGSVMQGHTVRNLSMPWDPECIQWEISSSHAGSEQDKPVLQLVWCVMFRQGLRPALSPNSKRSGTATALAITTAIKIAAIMVSYGVNNTIGGRMKR